MTGNVLSRILRIPIADIEIADGGRDLQDDKVMDIAASMQRIGMLSPIGVRMVDGNRRLVYGRHRLAAARSLGWTEIECHVLEADDRRARMAEIAENLHRAELTALERSDQIAEWLKLEAEDANDKPVQVAQVSPATGGRGNKGGLSEAAREIGVTREAARRAQSIAALPVEAKATAKDCGLDDNQSALLKAAKSSNPVRSLQQHAARARRSPQKIVRDQTGDTPAQAEADTALPQLFRAWSVATAQEKVEFISAKWAQDRGPWKDWVTETVLAMSEQPIVAPEAEAQTPTLDCIEAAEEAPPRLPPGIAVVTSTDDCIETAAEAAPCALLEALAENPTDNDVEAAVDMAAAGAGAAPAALPEAAIEIPAGEAGAPQPPGPAAETSMVYCVGAGAEVGSPMPPAAVSETLPHDSVEPGAQMASTTSPGMAEIPRRDCIEAQAEAPLPPSEAAVEAGTNDRVEPAAEATPLAVAPAASAETATDDGDRTAVTLSAPEFVDETPTDDRVGPTAEAAPAAIALQQSASVSAEELMAVFVNLKPNTQLCGRQWVADGCPIESRPDEHHIVAERLLPFRAALNKASETERQRFLELSAPRLSECMDAPVSSGPVEGVRDA